MMIGALLIPVFFVVTFAVPSGIGPLASGIWVLIAFMATATAFSLFQVPYIALPAEIADGYDQRTRLVSVRVVVLTVAILLFGAGGPSLRKLGGDDEHLGYLIMAIVAGLVIGIAFLITSRSALTRAPMPAERTSIVSNYRTGLAALRRSQPFRALLLTFGLQALATGIMLAGAQYVATSVLGDEGAIDLLFASLIAPALLFAPVWQLVARKLGKERGFVIASLLFAVAALSLIGLFWAPGAWIYAPVALAGAGYAGMQSLPLAMLPDVISHDNRGEAGTFGGVWTAGETTGMALGATVLTIVFAATGYLESTADQLVVQSPTAVAGIIAGFSIVPAAFILVSLLVFSRYRLRKVDIDA
jgi:Na+/melibiose symporter-like transporter